MKILVINGSLRGGGSENSKAPRLVEKVLEGASEAGAGSTPHDQRAFREVGGYEQGELAA